MEPIFSLGQASLFIALKQQQNEEFMSKIKSKRASPEVLELEGQIGPFPKTSKSD